MALTREALRDKLLQQLLAHPELNLKVWSDRELLASIRKTLEQQSSKEFWIFAYGSLIWNPLFPHLERHVVTVENWQRNFCLLAPVGRGTIANPGLVLGLERGKSCRGIAYRLEVDRSLEKELLLLWRREMVVGSYIPTWVKAKQQNRELDVLTFIVDTQHPTYISNLSPAEIARSLATAKGLLGSSAEYLQQTVAGLLAEGIRDEFLIELDREVRQIQGTLNS